MLDPNIWKPINNNSTGYLGKNRNSEWAKRDKKYGSGNWQMAWLVQGKYFEYLEVCMLYEDAYYNYFQLRPEVLEQLIKTASDVYDDSLENMQSGLDYLKRGAVRTHIQDIAIRRCVVRLGKKFVGVTPLQIRDRRGDHPLSLALSPGQVPFHMPEIISIPKNLKQITADSWWLKNSVEDFYQKGKRLCVKVSRQ